MHELTVHNRKRQERHLCEACAKAQGMAAGSAHVPPGGIPITHLLNEFITSQIQGAASPAPSKAPVGVCRSCGLTLNHFRQTGLLGCPDCYAAFESQLAPLLQKAHEGASQHTGKRPARLRDTESAAPAPPCTDSAGAAKASPATPGPANPAPDPTLLAATLRKKLAEAIAEERYEDAARLRDELLKLQTPAAPVPAKAARKSGSSPRSPKSPPKQPPADPTENSA